jgi:hypothetical protein
LEGGDVVFGVFAGALVPGLAQAFRLRLGSQFALFRIQC